ncbi:hypothetical protein LIER_20241 [Lithospermum erythrorhizon]|uniref:Uncharacterized protein n=1 Tax=Lithospermum erythrorhizon TaxID=34254 RepID=A0AAV3QKU4_LITER
MNRTHRILQGLLHARSCTGRFSTGRGDDRANLVPDHEFDTSGNPIRWAAILLTAKDTFLPNLVPLDRMKGKRPIAFKKSKVVKKGVSSPRSSTGVAATQRSSPIAAEPVSSIQPDLQRSSSSPLQKERRPAGKRPSEGIASQGRDKRPQTSPELEDLPKSGIPPSAFPKYDPLMAPGFLSSEFLEKPYTLPGDSKSARGPPSRETSSPSTL